MSKNSKKNSPKNEAPRQERGGLFNPFAELGAQLIAGKREKSGQNFPAGTSNAAGPSGAQAGSGNARNAPSKNFKHGKQQATQPTTSDTDDARLFLRAVGSSGFRPIKKDAAAEPGQCKGQRRADPQEDFGMAELLAMQERHPNSAFSKDRSADGPQNGKAAQTASSGSLEEAGYALNSAHETPGSRVKPYEEPAAPKLDAEEENLFAQAMRGVAPVDGKGRDLPLEKQESKSAPENNPPYLEDFLQGKFEFALEYTDEFFEGHVMGVDPLILSKLRAGQYSPESHVDLHGQNSEQAYESLVTFIRHAYGKGQRSLIVVTGRGKNSPGGLGILRQNMQDWLTREPLKRVVLAFCTAQPKDGGTGAIYVLLRKYKKSSGKIRWDKSGWGGVGVL